MNRLKQFFTGDMLVGTTGIVLLIVSIGCRPEEPECIPTDKVNVVEVEKTPIPPGELSRGRMDKDQCHACVQSKRGFYSCQTVWQTHKETRDELKKLAREKACVDAGWPKDECPEAAVKMVQCKGDAPPKDSRLAQSFRRLMVNQSATQKKTPTPDAGTRNDPNSDDVAKAKAPDATADGGKSEKGSGKYIPEVE
ncbi:MAG: hypothetical protein JXX14_09830 [Deltaproteobacteria bacterium]|nr:hypothetical protein [Deltaproteobacteria bacterium]